jgi:hypothetical protein
MSLAMQMATTSGTSGIHGASPNMTPQELKSRRERYVCVPKTLNTNVMVMKSAKNEVRFDASSPLNGPKG